MLDIEKSIKEFNKYAEKFDLENSHLKRKRSHSLRVMVLSTQISENLKKEEIGSAEYGEKEDIQVATLIGLLHDIARFEQYTQYETFVDKRSVDHGDFGVQLLKTVQKDTGKIFLRNFIETDQYDEIILKAIENHNKFKIEKELTPEEEIFCKMIRDADKLDIFYEAVEEFWKGDKEEVENLKISPYIEEHLYENKTIERKAEIVFNKLDKMISVLYFIFDLNYDISFKIVFEKDYMNKIINRFNFKDEETKEKVEEIRKIVNTYVKGRI